MKKIAFICIALLLILSGCKGSAQAPVATAAPTQDTSMAIEVPALTPAPTLQQTPAPTATLTSAPTEVPTPEPTDTPEPRERYVPEEGVETVAWLTDTQHYANYAAKDLPNIFPVMTAFLRVKAEEMNLVYVVHTGDLVHVNDSQENWTVAREAMDLLDGIPTGVLAGNHDMDPAKGGYKNYGKYFGEKQYNQ